MLARDADRIVEIVERQIGRDLEQHRHRAATWAHTFARIEHTGEQFVEHLGLLQIAQARRVGRGDVDGEIAGDGGESFDQLGVVADTVGAIAIGANIDADNAALVHARRQPLERGRRTLVVEAEPVNHALVRIEPEQAWTRIAGLWQRRDGTDLHKAEAKPQQGVRHLRVLVEAGGEADRIGEIKPERPDRQFRRIGGLPYHRHIAQGLDRQFMRVLRLKGPDKGTGQAVEETDHCGWLIGATLSTRHGPVQGTPGSYCRRGATQGYNSYILDESLSRGPTRMSLTHNQIWNCLLYTSDAADDLLCVDLVGRRIIKKKKN